jgi:2-aminoethylphosphonate dioxygenase
MSTASSLFTKTGYTLFKDQFSEEEVGLLNVECEMLIAKAENILKYTQINDMSLSEYYKSHPQEMVVVPEQSNNSEICRFEYIAASSTIIANTFIPKVKAIIDNTMQEPFVLFKDKCNVKNPGGGAFTPHQDIAAYKHFQPKYFVTAAIVLDKVTSDNGPLEMALDYKDTTNGIEYDIDSQFGSFPLFEFYNGGKNNGDIKSGIAANFRWEIIRANISDIFLFDAFVPHRSQKNNSKNRRRMFFFTFNPEAAGDFYEEYYVTKKSDFNNPIFHVSTPTHHE